MNLYLIRHGMTAGNQKKRYVGITEDPLCPEGIERLKRIKQRQLYPMPDLLYTSPMLRCQETAKILFPGKERNIVRDLRECDFGEFENKNYLELADNRNYQKWIDSNGQLPFPGGESRETFQRRSVAAFLQLETIWKNEGLEGKTAALVVHGGTIMSIMHAVGMPKGGYYDYQVKNGEGYRLEGENGQYRYQKMTEDEKTASSIS